MTRLSEQGATKLAAAIETLRAELGSAQFERELEPAQEFGATLARLQALKARLPQSLGGTSASATWNDLSDPEALSLSSELRDLRWSLSGLLGHDGPSHPSDHVMRRAYASTGVIWFLLVASFLCTGWTLVEILERWPAATGDVEAGNAPAKPPRLAASVRAVAPAAPSSASAAAASGIVSRPVASTRDRADASPL